MNNKRILFVITEDWALISHRLHLVETAISSGYEVGLATRITKYSELLERNDIKVYDWKLQRGSLNPIREILAFLSLLKILWTFRPNIIHAVAQKPIIYSGLTKIFYGKVGFISALGGVGFIFTNKNVKARLLRPIITFFLKIALSSKQTRLILQNNDNINVIKNIKVVNTSKIRLVKGAGVEIEKFLPSKIQNQIPTVILPGRMLWDKGVAEFVDLACRIKKRKVKAKFVLVGDIDLENPLSISKNQIEKWVNSGILEHWARRDDMEKIYPKISIVCLPSYNEGLPKVLLEGASCSRPLVAFDVPGCREVIKDGVNGFLVNFGDIDYLEKKILQLIKSRELCKKMGRKGRELIVSNFSSSIINSKTLDIWDEII